MVMGSKTQVSNLFLKRKSRTKIEGSKQKKNKFKKFNIKTGRMPKGNSLTHLHSFISPILRQRPGY